MSSSYFEKAPDVPILIRHAPPDSDDLVLDDLQLPLELLTLGSVGVEVDCPRLVNMPWFRNRKFGLQSSFLLVKRIDVLPVNEQLRETRVME